MNKDADLKQKKDQKIKVFHVITRMIIGGAQENTLYTVEGLHANPSFDVVLITGPAVGPEGDLLERCRGKGIDVRVLPCMRRAINPVRDVIAFFQLLYIFLKEKPRIVHTHSSKAGILGRIAAKCAGVNVIIHTVHGLPFHPYQSRMLNGLYVFLERLCVRISDMVIVVAYAMRDKCLARNIGHPGKYIRIFSGMESDIFIAPVRGRTYMRRDLGYADADFVVAKVARLFPLKGHSDVIRAAQKICGTDARVRFLFIGDGILRKKLEQEIASCGLEDRFRFQGLVPPAEVPDYIAAADMVVHASYREGLARVIPQSLIGDKPVVSYDIDGASEVVKDGVNGRLVPPGDVDGLAGAVTDVLKRYDIYTSNVHRSRDMVARDFSVEKMVKDITFCYLTFKEKWIK